MRLEKAREALLSDTPCPRLTRLVEAFERTLEAIFIKGVDAAAVRECCEPLIRSKGLTPERLESLRVKTFTDQVCNNAELEFIDICKELPLAESLARLQQVLDGKMTADQAQPPPQDPEASTEARDAIITAACESKRKRSEELEHRLQALRADRERLREKLDTVRAECAAKAGEAEALLGAVEACKRRCLSSNQSAVASG